MSKASFYIRLALSNIRKNGKFYIPYILTGAGTSMMLYIMLCLVSDEALKGSFAGNTVITFLMMGSFIVAFFSAILLFYSNGFLMKRRKKELGLFHILGMEKGHLAMVQFFETLIIAVISLGIGIGCGALFSKLMLLLLGKIVKIKIVLEFSFNVFSAAITAAVFLGIYLLTLIYNVVQIGRTSPIDLLKSENVGQREPKSKLLLVIIGVLSLGGGYTIALTVKSPLSAIALFFLAVILVIIGTYCLFMAGSIAVLKSLRRNKSYYYKTNHFLGVSGMIYRMKQNAAGLASICILSTMVLVMVSSTVALNVGMVDILNKRYPRDINIHLADTSENTPEIVENVIIESVGEHGMEVQDMIRMTVLNIGANITDEGFDYTLENAYESYDIASLYFMTDKEYSRISGQTVTLSDGEVWCKRQDTPEKTEFSMFGRNFKIVNEAPDFPIIGDSAAFIAGKYAFVVTEADFDFINQRQRKEYEHYSDVETYVFFNLSGSEEEIESYYDYLLDIDEIDFSTRISEALTALDTDEEGYEYMRFESRAENAEDMYSLYGSLLFLGIFLGTMFLMATILIIYYKQITEGYEDQYRFEVMQKVGLSEREVRKTIHSQVLTVFFLPLVTACVHIAFAFSIIQKLMSALMFTNVKLYILCVVATIAVFALVYAAVYAVTSRVYYKIVSR